HARDAVTRRGEGNRHPARAHAELEDGSPRPPGLGEVKVDVAFHRRAREMARVEAVVEVHGQPLRVEDLAHGSILMDVRIKGLETFTRGHIGLVRVTADDGAQGWGQFAPYNADITATVFHRQVAPR